MRAGEYASLNGKGADVRVLLPWLARGLARMRWQVSSPALVCFVPSNIAQTPLRRETKANVFSKLEMQSPDDDWISTSRLSASGSSHAHVQLSLYANVRQHPHSWSTHTARVESKDVLGPCRGTLAVRPRWHVFELRRSSSCTRGQAPGRSVSKRA